MSIFTLNSHDVCRILGERPPAFRGWVCTLDYRQPAIPGQVGGRLPRRFELASTVACIRQNRRTSPTTEQIYQLCDAAGTGYDPQTPLGADMDERARRFVACLNSEEEQRLNRACDSLLEGAAYALFSDLPKIDFFRLARTACLLLPITKYVLAGDRGLLPETAPAWAEFFMDYLRANGTPEEITTINGGNTYAA